MGDNLFEIRNLRCSYNKEDDVLIVKDLDVERGKIVIILGISGSGKSTILEILGLMNNTLREGSVYFYPSDKKYDFARLWRNKDYVELAKLRKQHFSFMFQNTNLMPNFTAFENISLTQMLEDVSQKDAIDNAKSIAQKMGLNISEEKKAHELSGGEKQRAAFIRAIAPNYTVLFGDEPTGNLDAENADMLMKMLTKSVKDKKCTAIIVTHDIDLAIKYADQLIVMKMHNYKKDEEGYGEIKPEQVFKSRIQNNVKQWYNSNNRNITNELKKIIRELLANHKNNKNFTI